MLLCLFMMAVTRKMNEYKDKILTRIDEKFDSLETNILADLKYQMKHELAGVLIQVLSEQKELKNNVKVKLDLTKSRCTIFTRAIETAKQSNVVDYVMVDINCQLKVVFNNGRSKFFTDGNNLNHVIEEEIN